VSSSKFLSNSVRGLKDPEILQIFDELEVLKYGSGSYGIFNPEKSVFVADELPVNEMLEAMSRHRVQSFVQLENGSLFVPSLVVAGGLRIMPGRFLKDPLRFFFPTFDPAKRQTAYKRKAILTFQSSNDVGSLLDRVEEFAAADKLSKSVVKNLTAIADELAANALRAPTDENGHRIFSNEPAPGVELNMGSTSIGRIILAHDDERFLISAEDPFGSIDHAGLWSGLEEVFAPDLNEIGIPENASLGLKMMIDRSIEFALVSKKNIMTSVSCVVRLGISARERAKLGKSLHFKFF
jgi:hypothetical protein